MKQMNRSYSFEQLYEELGITRQGHWDYCKREMAEQLQEQNILKEVIRLRKNHPKMGSRPLFHTLKDQGIDLGVGINKFETILRKNEFCVGGIKKNWPKTSDGLGKENYPNLLDGLVLNDINQAFVGDITYYFADNQWHFIISLKDVYSQIIVGLEVSVKQDTQAVKNCLKSAIKFRGRENLKGCIHHTDNGSQYNAKSYKAMLSELGMRISRAESCIENGSSEQLHNIIKNMYFEPWGVVTFEEMKKAKSKFLKLNNNERNIALLGNKSPANFEQYIKYIPVTQRKVKTLYDFSQHK
jgi:hypothetical protein